MDIIQHFILLYIHLILHLVPYMVGGVAVYAYFLYKDIKTYNDAVTAYMIQFDVTYEEATAVINAPPATRI